MTVNEYAFSDLYTYLAERTSLPRKDVKEAVIAKFYGMEDHPTWEKIVTALKSKIEQEEPE